MTIFLHAIETKQDGESMIRQIKAAKAMGIGRVGIFEKTTVGSSGYTSGSYDADYAVKIVERYTVKM